MTPDPKPPPRRRNASRRIVDRAALSAARATLPTECACCGQPASDVHHLLPRGAPYFGDDVFANLIRLCGSGGASGCHGAVHGSPYLDARGRRWTPEEVRGRVGTYLLEQRPDTIQYVLGKLGPVTGTDWLRRRYRLWTPPT